MLWHNNLDWVTLGVTAEKCIVGVMLSCPYVYCIRKLCTGVISAGNNGIRLEYHQKLTTLPGMSPLPRKQKRASESSENHPIFNQQREETPRWIGSHLLLVSGQITPYFILALSRITDSKVALNQASVGLYHSLIWPCKTMANPIQPNDNWWCDAFLDLQQLHHLSTYSVNEPQKRWPELVWNLNIYDSHS